MSRPSKRLESRGIIELSTENEAGPLHARVAKESLTLRCDLKDKRLEMARPLRIRIVSPFIDETHGTERCVAEQVERLLVIIRAKSYSSRQNVSVSVAPSLRPKPGLESRISDPHPSPRRHTSP